MVWLLIDRLAKLDSLVGFGKVILCDGFLLDDLDEVRRGSCRVEYWYPWSLQSWISVSRSYECLGVISSFSCLMFLIVWCWLGVEGDTTIHDWLWDAVPRRGDDGKGSKSDWLVVKSVVLTVQFLGGFEGRWAKDEILPFGVLTTGVQLLPNLHKN